MRRMVVSLFMSILIILLFSVTIVISSSSSLQQQPYLICGHVWDNNGELAIDEEVTLTNLRTKDIQKLKTNEYGEFLFECLNSPQEYYDGDKFNVFSRYESKIVKVDITYCGIQIELNKPSDIPVEPIVAGTVLVAAAGGLYYYIKRKKKSVKEDKKDKMVEEIKEKKENPLWLPEGSIRAILAIIALVGVVVCVALGIETPEYLKTIVGMIIAFFFGNHVSVRK